MVHELHRTQWVEADPGIVWDFFSDPRNLNALTPPSMHFEIQGDPARMYAGQLISYRIRLAPGVRVSWLTEICHVNPGRYFVDEQRRGPYALWYHQHHFEPRDGGVELTDRVTYALPFGPLGSLVHVVWVRRQLRQIFDYRADAVRSRFGG